MTPPCVLIRARRCAAAPSTVRALLQALRRVASCFLAASHGPQAFELTYPVLRSSADSRGIYKAGMKRARFSEEQIIEVLKEAEGGAKVTELCRRHGISDATFYTWRSKYGGLEISEMRRLRQLEEENRRLKSIVADQALDIRALKDVLAKNGYGPR